ncbi:hypothetical protein TSUD_394740 [Trifolium subterraneum]|uniref:Uncharacterized protein n=1 Tax=Trifolium subterraneum TaxID=3900 RepID=A0A2Z6MSJ9_TRISU|nr:hypothetical protein TSUD_394740 [Trifolium subterraneum]
MRAATKRRGIEITSISRPIKSSDFVECDLILAMDKQNRGHMEAFNRWRFRDPLPEDAHKKMNAGEVELKFLSDVFDSGAISFVDELFLRCHEKGDDDKTNAVTSKENCMDVYKSLRSSGVYVHQLWGDEIAYKIKP